MLLSVGGPNFLIKWSLRGRGTQLGEHAFGGLSTAEVSTSSPTGAGKPSISKESGVIFTPFEERSETSLDRGMLRA